MLESFTGGHQRERVLIVAPDEDARSMLAFLLRAEGFNVYCLADAPRAVVLLTLCRGPVTVLLDGSVPPGERQLWFHLLNPIAQVRGVVLRQRAGAARPGAGPRRHQGRLPCVEVGDPLCIATLVEALATVATRAERGQTGAARERDAASQGESAPASAERPRPA